MPVNPPKLPAPDRGSVNRSCKLNGFPRGWVEPVGFLPAPRLGSLGRTSGFVPPPSSSTHPATPKGPHRHAVARDRGRHARPISSKLPIRHFRYRDPSSDRHEGACPSGSSGVFGPGSLSLAISRGGGRASGGELRDAPRPSRSASACAIARWWGYPPSGRSADIRPAPGRRAG